MSAFDDGTGHEPNGRYHDHTAVECPNEHYGIIQRHCGIHGCGDPMPEPPTEPAPVSDILARIDAALEGFASARAGHGAASMHIPSAENALRAARAEIVRLSALIPEPPTDEEREPLAWAVYGRKTGRLRHVVTDEEEAASLSEHYDLHPLWRNRHRGPITDEMVEAGAKAALVPLAAGLGITFQVRAALEAARAAER